MVLPPPAPTHTWIRPWGPVLATLPCVLELGSRASHTCTVPDQAHSPELGSGALHHLYSPLLGPVHLFSIQSCVLCSLDAWGWFRPAGQWLITLNHLVSKLNLDSGGRAVLLPRVYTGARQRNDLQERLVVK